MAPDAARPSAFHDRRAIAALIREVFAPDFAVSKRHRDEEIKPAGLVEAIADQL